MQWCSGSTCIVVDCSIPWNNFYFSSCGKYELILHMNSYIWWIQYEFIYFLYFKYKNSYKYEFILCMNSYTLCSYHVWIHIFFPYEFILCMNSYTFCSYHVWIHIFFAVQNKSCERARAASAQRKPWGRSPSSPPAPTRPRPAAPNVRVACGSPDS